MSKIQLTDLNNSSHLTELGCDRLDSITGGKNRKRPSPHPIPGAPRKPNILF